MPRPTPFGAQSPPDPHWLPLLRRRGACLSWPGSVGHDEACYPARLGMLGAVVALPEQNDATRVIQQPSRSLHQAPPGKPSLTESTATPILGMRMGASASPMRCVACRLRCSARKSEHCRAVMRDPCGPSPEAGTRVDSIDGFDALGKEVLCRHSWHMCGAANRVNQDPLSM